LIDKDLEMIFINQAGRNVTIRVADPKDGLTAAEVQSAMQVILNSNVFTSSGGDFVDISGARTVAREVVDLF